MSVSHVKYLLIGGGLASSTAAQAIRALDPRGELMLIGQERIRPYHRPPLSKGYLRQQRTGRRPELFVQPPEWYADNRVQLRTGVRASHLDANRRSVALENGQEIAFDRLLIATGMAPDHLKIPGHDWPNVHYVRSVDDADRLHHAIEKALGEGLRHERAASPAAGVGRGRAAVIGGGLLGVELAATLAQLGLAVDLVVSQPHPWARFAGENTGRFIARYLESRGVSVHVGRPPARLDGDGRAQRVDLGDGSAPIPCDFVVAAVGATVNRELLRSTPINSEKAILVDPHCRTNVEGIYAAGDCCAVYDSLFGKHRVLDHWPNAVLTGHISGTHMAGGEARYDGVNHFDSEIFDLTLLAWGEPRLVDRRLIRGAGATGNGGNGTAAGDRADLIEIGIAADGRIAQVLAINHPGESELLRELVARRVRVEGNEEALKDPSVPLATLLD